MHEHLMLISWIVAGAVLGVVYLFLIGRTVAALRPPFGRSAAWGYFVLRIAVAAGVLTLAARAGALPLLSCLAGFLVARSLMLRRLSGS